MSPTDLDRIDERGRAAATDLRARATARPRPAFDAEAATALAPPAPIAVRRAWRDPRWLAAAAVIVAVLLAGAIWAGTRSTDDDGPTDVTTTEVRPFRPAVVPDGLELAGAAQLGPTDLAAEGIESGPLVVYGPSPDDPAVGVTWVGDEGIELDEGSAVAEIDGRTVSRLDTGGVLAPVVGVVAPGGGVVLVVGAGVGEDQLAELAAATTVAGSRASLPDAAVPDGWQLLGEDPEGVFGISTGAMLRGTSTVRSRSVIYADTDVGETSEAEVPGGDQAAPEPIEPDARSITVVSSTGGDAAMLAARVLSPEATEIEVRGHDGLLIEAGSEGGDISMITVQWFESPGELVRVLGIDLATEEVLAIAESVEPIPNGEWADLLERTALGDFIGGDTGVELARGDFADGTAWVLRDRSPDDGSGYVSLDLQVALDGDSSSSSMGSGSASLDPSPDAGLRSFTVVEIGGRRFAAVLVRPTVVTVRVLAGDGTVQDELDATPLADPADGSWVVFEVPDGADRLALVAEDGTVVEPDGANLTEPDGANLTDLDDGPVVEIEPGPGIDGGPSASEDVAPTTVVGQAGPAETTVPG